MISGYMKPQILFRTTSEARSETGELVRVKRRTETTQQTWWTQTPAASRA